MITRIVEKIAVKKTKRKAQPIYEQIRRQFRHMIETDELKVGVQLPSISALSQELNVNYRTVKSALELLEKDGVISCGPNRHAVVTGTPESRMSAKEKMSISFIRLAGAPFWLSISEGISRFVQECKSRCIFVDAASSHEKVINAIVAPGEGINGLLLAPFELPEYKKAINKAINNGIKIVFVDRELHGLDVSSVSADHFSGAYQATKHLLNIHERPVYHIGTINQLSSCREWVKGWKAAMSEYNFTDFDSYLFKTDVTEAEVASSEFGYLQHDVRNATRFFETHKEKVYYIFAGNDYVARGVYIAAENKGLKVGQDIFIVGFNNSPFAKRLSVPLTSVKQPSEQVGYEAARVLYERLSGVLSEPVHRLLPVNLIIRQSSTGVPNSEKQDVNHKSL